MNWDQIEVDWMQFKGKIRNNWVKLTDEDLTRIGGRRKELASRLQARYGFGRSEAEREIEAWVKTQRHAA
ncbi:MAG TPA: CsbD family protein [Xanthobacteraceae bacterium]|nr:CsbD family protein [Xanthobacteraceae bacterium]